MAVGSISRLISSIAAISLYSLVVAGPVLAAEGRKEGAPAAFHQPQTEAERSLDAILQLSGKEPESSWFAVEAPWRDKTRDILFQSLFSQRLRDSWVSAERKAVRESCNGAYIEGEICGIDIHPITCSQDSNEIYMYRTSSSSPGSAIVEYRWPQTTKTIATFRLLRKGNGWMIDGIDCIGYLKFNMP